MEIETILKKYKKVAVVGISANSARPSHWIAVYLKEKGYEVTGVNPGLPTIPGIPVVASLSECPQPLEIVDVFRSPDAIPAIVEEAARLGAPVLWLQPGAENPEAEDDARERGMEVIAGPCIFAEHRDLFG